MIEFEPRELPLGIRVVCLFLDLFSILSAVLTALGVLACLMWLPQLELKPGLLLPCLVSRTIPIVLTVLFYGMAAGAGWLSIYMREIHLKVGPQWRSADFEPSPRTVAARCLWLVEVYSALLVLAGLIEVDDSWVGFLIWTSLWCLPGAICHFARHFLPRARQEGEANEREVELGS